MKISSRTILCTAAIALLLMVVVFTSSLHRTEHAADCCSAVAVNFEGPQSYVSEREIIEGIENSLGPVTGMRADSVSLAAVETAVDSVSAVLESQAWITGDGVLHVSVTQRTPLLRFTGLKRDYFVDAQGCLFPSPDSCEADVPTISGELPIKLAQGFKGKPTDEKQRQWVSDILKLAGYLNGSGGASAMIRSIKVLGNGELVMSTTEDGPTVLFGRPENIESKFSRLEKYFLQVEPEVGEGHYGKVNLKYDGQLICTEI